MRNSLIAFALSALALSASATTVSPSTCTQAVTATTCADVPTSVAGASLEIQRYTVPQEYRGGGYPPIPAYVLVTLTFQGVSYTVQKDTNVVTGPNAGLQTWTGTAYSPEYVPMTYSIVFLAVKEKCVGGRICRTPYTYSVVGGSFLINGQ